MGLQKAGYWDPDSKGWDGVGSFGCATLSWVDGDDGFYGALWNAGLANVEWDNQRFPQPVVASEHCGSVFMAGFGFICYGSMNSLLYDIFRAYYDARRNKRNTLSQLDFERDFEHQLFQLYEDFIAGSYTIGPSICFVISDPVQREVFASSFRDRVVHHLVYNYVYSFFDKHFIHDSYSCRLGKGTHYGVKRVDHFIRSCSQNYMNEGGGYILKLDIQGFFMSIDKQILKKTIADKLQKYQSLGCDKDRLLRLIYQIIDHDATQNYIFKGNKSDYDGLPKEKSLFFAGVGKGLPIGNLTSQLFANIYLDDFDKFIKYELGIKYYGRYVDDFIIIHTDKAYLQSLVGVIKQYLEEKLQLILHPRKIYLQHYTKGVKFLGMYIKPRRIYIHRRTVGNFTRKMSRISSASVTKKELQIINSYLGLLKHGKNFTIRKKLLTPLSNISFDECFTCGTLT